MTWNWQQADWPHFKYDATLLASLETDFAFKSGELQGVLAHINKDDKNQLLIDLVSTEAVKTSEIEGEYLDRESLQSSLRRQFKLDDNNQRIAPAEQGIAEMLVDLYNNYAQPLTHETLFNWHRMLTKGRNDLHDVGRYRTHKEAMQVISGYYGAVKVHFEAPPSIAVPQEMERFIDWFNNTKDLPALTRAGIAHLYFVCIHPFEDGNGRIGRAIAEKSLSQSLGQPTLISLSSAIMNKRRDYYDLLEKSNKTNQITDWLIYFAQTIMTAQKLTLQGIEFIITKAKFYDKMRCRLNARQEKVIARLFQSGTEGFTGGLSAENYISIAKTSRATATRDLQELVELGVLLKTGELKGTRYHLVKKT